LVESSYETLAVHATVHNFLPPLAERFAGQRLHAMAERGIDISGEYPEPWTLQIV